MLLIVISVLYCNCNCNCNYNKIINFVPDLSGKLQMLLIVALIFGSVGGLVVAAILKLLDNIVKVKVRKARLFIK